MNAPDDRPGWAQALPSKQSLDYARSLGVVVVGLVLVLYVMLRLVDKPGRAVKLARKRVGI